MLHILVVILVHVIGVNLEIPSSISTKKNNDGHLPKFIFGYCLY